MADAAKLAWLREAGERGAGVNHVVILIMLPGLGVVVQTFGNK